MNPDTLTIHFKTISDFQQVIGVSKPKHPLFSIHRFEDLPPVESIQRTKLISDFYKLERKTHRSHRVGGM